MSKDNRDRLSFQIPNKFEKPKINLSTTTKTSLRVIRIPTITPNNLTDIAISHKGQQAKRTCKKDPAILTGDKQQLISQELHSSQCPL